MTDYFMGNELSAFNISAGTAEVTTASNGTPYESTFVRCAIRVGNGSVSHNISTPQFTSLTTIWAHFALFNDGADDVGVTPPFLLRDSTTAQVFRMITVTNAFTLKCQYWNGSSWTDIGSTFSHTVGSLIHYDIKVIRGASGSFELYQNNSLVTSGSASMTAFSNFALAYWYFCRSTGTTGWHVSQAVISDTNTVGVRYYEKSATANGANTAWSGVYSDINEVVLDDGTFISTSTANDIETNTGAAISIGSFTVRGVAVNMRCKNNGSAPVNIQAALRIGGTNYFGSNVSMSGTGFTPTSTIFANDPSTSSAWTNAAAGASTIEFGAKAIT